jgi:hypothetical protein
VGGSATVLGRISNQGSSPGQVNSLTTWYNLKVTVSGTNIKAYVDDVLKFDITDSAFSSGTAGIWLESMMDAEFDNASVECDSVAGGTDPVVVDTLSTGSTSDDTITISHTTSGTNRLMLVGVSTP